MSEISSIFLVLHELTNNDNIYQETDNSKDIFFE